MKKVVLTAFCALASPLAAAPAEYTLDPTHTVVMFDVFHIGFAPTISIFEDVEGSFTYDMETQNLSDVSVTIAAKSVNTFLEARDKHVRNADFLNVRKHPEITFVATDSKPTSATTGTVTGDLTILGQTHPITLDVKLNKAATYPFGHQSFVLGLSLTGEIQRSRYGMDYAVAGDIVGDTVKIRIETEAIQSK
ncbi:MAG: YceI family protein [Pseudomonadota bacterium]